MKNQYHIIEKVLIEVNTSNVETANSIKNNIDFFLKDELFPQLEILFDEYPFRNEIIRFDEIKINLKIDKWDDLSRLKSDIYNQLQEKINSKVNKRGIQEGSIEDDIFNKGNKDFNQISSDINLTEVFLFFLEYGYLPWFGNEGHINTFVQKDVWTKSLENEHFLQKTDYLFKTKAGAVERFILQFSDDIITGYLSGINSAIKKEISGILKISKYLNHDFRLLFFKLLLKVSMNEYENFLETLKFLESAILKSEKQVAENNITNQVIKDLKEIVKGVIPVAILKQTDFIEINKWIYRKQIISIEIDKQQQYATTSQPNISDINKAYLSNKFNETESKDFNKEQSAFADNLHFFDKKINEIWVRNAGLIVLHPFIKPFFIATGICDKQGKFLTFNFDVAVQSLHYLATGNENVFEGNLVFEKFLCGVPLKFPVQQKSLLTDSIKEEATVLLNEVVKNWPALKNTSADGLRQMFIQRDGKLIQKEDNFKLIVERKAQDVLLEKLNWNISMIKLPWISKILFTEW